MQTQHVALWLSFLLVGVGCSHAPVVTDSEFIPYQEAFLAQGRKHGANFEPALIQFGELGKVPGESSLESIAECHHAGSGRPTPLIIVDSLRWSWLSESEREVVIFHELGHCLLGIAHGEGIMETQLLDGFNYEVQRQRWLDRLFAGHL